MGLKKGGRYRYYLPVRLDEELWLYIEELRKALGVSRSEAVRRMLRFATMLDPEKVKKMYDKLKL